MMSEKSILQVTGAMIGVLGFCVVGFMSSWWVSFGVFAMLFGNNLERATHNK